MLPYSFCSNFYCTLNARELGNLISSIKYGRGKTIPELQDLAQQLLDQVSNIFPALFSEFEQESTMTCDDNDIIWMASNDSIELVEANEIGSVKLLQAPLQPMEILKFASSISHPHGDNKFDIRQIIASTRPRELEHLSYTFAISNMTLSGITHLVRHRMQSIVVPSIHILPFTHPIWPNIISDIPGTDFESVDSYEKLYARWQNDLPNSYLLFQDLNQRIYYISDASKMPSQLFRKCLAPHLDAAHWDWRSEAYSDNIIQTIELFSQSKNRMKSDNIKNESSKRY